MRPHNHWLDVSLTQRNVLARAACVARRGPPPPAHHTKSARNIASTAEAVCTPNFKSNSSQTFEAMSATRKPAITARRVTGTLAQRLGARADVVIVVASEGLLRIVDLLAGYLSS